MNQQVAFASLGALVRIGATAARKLRRERDFAWEWADLFRVKHKVPFGDEAEQPARSKK